MVVKIFCVLLFFLAPGLINYVDCGATGAVFLPPLQMKSECEAGSEADKGVNKILRNSHNIRRRHTQPIHLKFVLLSTRSSMIDSF